MAEIPRLRNVIRDECLPKATDLYTRNALAKIDSLLQEMQREYVTHTLKPKQERYRNIARLAAELDPSVLSPELGGKLIEVEEAYRAI